MSDSYPRRAILLGVASALIFSLTGVPPAVAAVSAGGIPANDAPSVSGRDAKVAQRPSDGQKPYQKPTVTWPQAGSGSVVVPARMRGLVEDGPLRQQAGQLPITIKGDGASSETVRVSLLDRDKAQQAGINGMLLTLDRPGRAKLDVTVDYSGFAHAFGGDFGKRLRLVQLPACAATTPGAAGCRTATPLKSTNDTEKSQVSVATNDKSAVFALVAAAGSQAGDFAPTTLAPSATWSVGLESGAFNWSYELKAPGAPGMVPSIVFGYDSSAMDGRTAATNNQSSSIGDGFNHEPGFIERKFVPCSKDGHATMSDECWNNQNAVIVLPNVGGELVRVGDTNLWRSEHDSGWRFELLTGAVNGDDNGEYWKATSPDGTQYFFGLNHLPGWQEGNAETKSAYTVPVFGDDAGEPCYSPILESAWCQQAYRMNLDLVIDRNGNAMSYFYNQESNKYGRGGSAVAATSYVRGGQLARIEYGQRADSLFSVTAPARVLFNSAQRCIPGSSCTPSDYPDTPMDLQCDGTSCPAPGPSFFTTKRLAEVRTAVYTNASYKDVDSWTLTHTFPATGDNESPTLWLESIVRTGYVGGAAIAMPEVNFDGVQLRNRVLNGSYTPMWKWRLNRINNESGGRIEVAYNSTTCDTSTSADSSNNPYACYPVFWSPAGASTPIRDWMYKYLVTQVAQTDPVGGNPTQVTAYEYVGGAAWAHDENELTDPFYKDWGQWRGYGRVRVREGDGSTSPQTLTEHRLFRGMDGDLNANNTTKDVWVVDSTGNLIEDKKPLRGISRETLTYNGVDTNLVGSTLVWPTIVGPTASRQQGSTALEAYLTNITNTRSREKLTDGSFRYTEQKKGYDNLGRVKFVDELGDVTTAADDKCTNTTYFEDQTLWLMSFPTRVHTVAVNCDTAPSFPGDIISDELTSYDAKGNPIETKAISGYAGSPVYTTVAKMGYDAHGRVIESENEIGAKTTKVFTPAVGGPVTAESVTNALGHTSITTFDPALSQVVSTVDQNGRRTDLSYDALGRLIKVWQPGRTKGTDNANIMYDYVVRATGPSYVTSRRLQANGTSYVVSHELYDGFLRSRQSQAPSPAGGRIITDTLYDSAGRVRKTNAAYYNSSSPTTTLLVVADTAVPSQTVFEYDAVGRGTAEILRGGGVEKWRTTTAYPGGDQKVVTPPAGGIATTQVLDAQGRVVELRQHKTGAYDATKFQYNKAGQLSTVTDPAGNKWRYDYDLRGRKVRTEEPDAGVTTYTHTPDGQIATRTDARGETVAFGYDALGRKSGMFAGSLTGAKLAEWTFDTLPGGKGLAAGSARFVGGNAYRTNVSGYDVAGRATGSKVIIPASEGALAGTYEAAVTYTAVGQIATTTVPAAGDLTAETLTFGYNALGMPTTMSSPLAQYVSTSYTNLGLVSTNTMGNSGKYAYQSFVYDSATNRLNRTVISRQNVTPTVVADLNYTYDPSGNVTRLADKPSGGTNDIQCFRTDYLTRITDAWTPSTDDCATNPSTGALGGPAAYWHSYTYDVTGNRLSEVRHAGGGDVTRNYSYPAAGQPKPHAVTSVGSDSYTYDAAGKLTGRPGGQALTWDTEGRLATITSGGNSTSHIYDADGNRLLRKGSSPTLYLGNTEVVLTGTVAKATRSYSSGQGTIAVRTSAGLSWLVNDQHGTDLGQIDQATLAVTTRRALPFGEVRGAVPASWKVEKGFVDGTLDESGLTHIGAREYDPALGRFISVDPITDHNDPQSVNGYAYATNNPLTFTDPTGLAKAKPKPDPKPKSKPKEPYKNPDGYESPWQDTSCKVKSCTRTWADDDNYCDLASGHTSACEGGSYCALDCGGGGGDSGFYTYRRDEPKYSAPEPTPSPEIYTPRPPTPTIPTLPCGGWTQCLPVPPIPLPIIWTYPQFLQWLQQVGGPTPNTPTPTPTPAPQPDPIVVPIPWWHPWPHYPKRPHPRPWPPLRHWWPYWPGIIVYPTTPAPTTPTTPPTTPTTPNTP